jgi:hypothetical protein
VLDVKIKCRALKEDIPYYTMEYQFRCFDWNTIHTYNALDGVDFLLFIELVFSKVKILVI